MLWFEAFHVIFMVTWFAGLFYLPRLFVYHAMSKDEVSNSRFKLMERKLFFGIMTPGAILTIVFGLIVFSYAPRTYLSFKWFDLKILFVLFLLIYHLYLWKVLINFRQDRNIRSHVFYRWLNEVPVIFLVSIIILVIVKPWGTL